MFKQLPAFLTAIALLICPTLLPEPALAASKALATTETMSSGQLARSKYVATGRKIRSRQLVRPKYRVTSKPIRSRRLARSKYRVTGKAIQSRQLARTKYLANRRTKAIQSRQLARTKYSANRRTKAIQSRQLARTKYPANRRTIRSTQLTQPKNRTTRRIIPSRSGSGVKYLATGKTIQPGQAINLYVSNRTPNTVQVEIPSYAGPYTMPPKRALNFKFNLRRRDRGVSVLYWTPKANLPIQAKVAKPNAKTLRVELHPSRFPSDNRAIYDSEFPGTVRIF